MPHITKIAFIGSGRMATALGGALSRAGHRIVDIDNAEVVFVAVPWRETARLPQLADQLADRVVITCTNRETAGGLPQRDGESATEAIARALPRSRVAGALHNVYAELLQPTAPFDSGAPSGFYCGDDPLAREAAASLIASLGLDAVDCGPLANAHMLESLAQLMVYLVRVRGFGPEGVAMRVMYRDEAATFAGGVRRQPSAPAANA